MISVLFICLGNICRSPMAEAVMQQLVLDAGLAERIMVDSVGVGDWHIGRPAHPGTLAILRRHNIPYADRARQITHADVTSADYLIAMDSQNLADVRAMLPTNHTKALHLLLEWAPDGFPRDVPDPYYSGNFEAVFRLVDAGCRGLLAHIRATHEI